MDNLVIIKAKLNKCNPFNQQILDDSNKIIYNNIGCLISLNDKPHVLTCFHCIKNTYDQKIYYKKKSYYARVSYISDELELALMEIESNDYDKFKTLNLNDFNLNLNLNEKELLIKSKDLDKFIKKRNNKSINLKCELEKIITDELCNMTSLNIPSLPHITVKLKKKYLDASELKGLSGSIVLLENKIIGLVSALEDSKIRVIPSVIILRFLREIINSGRFNGISSIVGKFSICDFEMGENGKTYGIYIDDTFDINYNNYDYTNKQNFMNLRKNDIIIEINNNKINRDGKIYDESLKVELNYRTYIVLNYVCGDNIPIKILRCNKKKENDYKEKKIIIKARPLNSMKYIPITFNGLIINYKGFIFIEISEDIILNYNNLGIDIGQSLNQYFLEKPYRNEDEHIVTLIDIEKSKFNKKNLDIINEIGLPLICQSNKSYILPILKKINKKKILNLKDLEKMLLNDEKIFSINVGNSSKIKIKEKSSDDNDLEIKLEN